MNVIPMRPALRYTGNVTRLYFSDNFVVMIVRSFTRCAGVQNNTNYDRDCLIVADTGYITYKVHGGAGVYSALGRS